MDYEFGDIVDARKAPGIGHFMLIVGETVKKDKVTKEDKAEVMYYIITSRVYAVFKSILAYFNDCLTRGDVHFTRFFNKEKEKTKIMPHGLLSQAVFLDKETNYNSCLDVESMIVINRDPELIDKLALETLRNDGKVVNRNRLAKLDALNIIHTIKYSKEVSPDKQNKISACFNKIKSTLK